MVKRYDWKYDGMDDYDLGSYVHYDDYAALEARLAELEKDAALWRYAKEIHTEGWVAEVEDRASREA